MDVNYLGPYTSPNKGRHGSCFRHAAAVLALYAAGNLGCPNEAKVKLRFRVELIELP